ncbi:hypothetical protein BY458DRAFT_484786 [Sporodiniella umbellata]|nr:hypothetical protein BY458DRAFT_484786 [Sporodiniella umbellata]
MTESWDRIQFDKELKSILESKLPVSASKITSLQSLATLHPKHHNYITQSIARFIETAPPDYRLAGLYVIDAISRVVHKQLRKRDETNEQGVFEAEGYLKRFAIVLKEDALQGCFEPCSVKDKDKVKKTLDFWEQGNIYPKEVVQYVKGSFLNQSKEEKAPVVPPVDTASLLATLSNIGQLNIPGLTTPNVPAPAVSEDTSLPPALAKLLSGIVTTSSAPSVPAVPNPPAPFLNAPTAPRPDPRRTKDPRQKTWEAPVRKSRWAQESDPWLNRQAMTAHYPYYPPQYGYAAQPVRPSPFAPPLASDPPRPYPRPPPLPPASLPPLHPQLRIDTSLAPGYIRVLTRTLFVGPIPDHYEKEDVARLFSKYGEIASVIVSKKLKGRHNAFLKYTTRAATEAAKYNGAGLMVEGIPVKVNWGFGFGPKKHFDYTRGDSVIPLSELSEEEKDNLVIARIGGFQGQPVRDGVMIEEPEAQYKPEWKENDRGLKRGMPPLLTEDHNRKRRIQ